MPYLTWTVPFSLTLCVHFLFLAIQFWGREEHRLASSAVWCFTNINLFWLWLSQGSVKNLEHQVRIYLPTSILNHSGSDGKNQWVRFGFSIIIFSCTWLLIRGRWHAEIGEYIYEFWGRKNVWRHSLYCRVVFCNNGKEPYSFTPYISYTVWVMIAASTHPLSRSVPTSGAFFSPPPLIDTEVIWSVKQTQELSQHGRMLLA